MELRSQPIKASAVLHPETKEFTESAMLLSSSNAPEILNCLGVAAIAPGQPATSEMAHSTSEVMFVSQGRGLLITPDKSVRLSKGDAVFIPQDLPHSLDNTGDEPLVSVFSFPSPNRPEDSKTHESEIIPTIGSEGK